jgi:hypothetical protein
MHFIFHNRQIPLVTQYIYIHVTYIFSTVYKKRYIRIQTYWTRYEFKCLNVKANTFNSLIRFHSWNYPWNGIIFYIRIVIHCTVKTPVTHLCLFSKHLFLNCCISLHVFVISLCFSETLPVKQISLKGQNRYLRICQYSWTNGSQLKAVFF